MKLPQTDALQKLSVELLKRSNTIKGFKVLARRLVAERTFDWLMHQRRLVRDYETAEPRPWSGSISP